MSTTLQSVPHSLSEELSPDGRNLVVALDSLNAVLATTPPSHEARALAARVTSAQATATGRTASGIVPAPVEPMTCRLFADCRHVPRLNSIGRTCAICPAVRQRDAQAAGLTDPLDILRFIVEETLLNLVSETRWTLTAVRLGATFYPDAITSTHERLREIEEIEGKFRQLISEDSHDEHLT